MYFDTIFTLNARYNVFLEIMTSCSSLTEEEVFHEIQQMHSELKSMLIKKGIRYEDLKGALIPNPHKNEVVFAFDTNSISSIFYGQETIDLILPLLNSDTTQSILHGSWIIREYNEVIAAIFTKEFARSKISFSGKFENLYFVYINNCSDKMINDFIRELSKNHSYVGCLSLNSESYMKDYFSTILPSLCLKHKNTVILPHEDDRNEDENMNLIGYNFEDFGYKIKSFPSYLYDVFLTYKVESSIFDPEAIDIRFSLNAISEDPMFLNDMEIQIEDKKLKYLKEKKAGSLKRADLFELSSKRIAEKIKEKISSNYIYNLSRSNCGKIVKFDIIIECAANCKTMCAMEYKPKEKKLRLITIF